MENCHRGQYFCENYPQIQKMKKSVDFSKKAWYYKQALGPVVQLVRTLACHARGRGFEPHPGRQICLCSSVGRAGD